MPAPFRVALSGTPVENRLDELWSQLHFANPGLLGARADFDERYAQPIADGDADVAAWLRARIRPFILRRRKDEVAPELPPRQEILLRCTLSDDERGVYDTVRAATVPGVVEQLRAGGNVMRALEALLRLRQACCHAGLVPGQPEHASTKLELLRDRLESAVADGHKALVFSQWTSLLDRTEPVLEEAGLRFTRLDGSTRDRGGVVADFSRDDGPPVLLLSLRAGGTGLNLTQADHVFLLDPWWNPAVEDQAADRAHRIGQTRPVLVHRIVARDSVEERILALQQRKRALADAALEGGRRDRADAHAGRSPRTARRRGHARPLTAPGPVLDSADARATDGAHPPGRPRGAASMKIVILGGSMTGLGAALLLARDGHDVTVLEKDAAPLPATPVEAFETWERRGAPQVRHSHAFLARLRNLLHTELPDVLARLLEEGAEELRFLDLLPPTLEDRSPRPDDDELTMLGCRRLTFEWVLRRIVDQEPGITFRDGTAVSGLVPGPARDGRPTVAGVEIDGRDPVVADLVVDAMGRRSPLPRFLEAIDVPRPREESEDSGIFYCSRFYRSAGRRTRPSATRTSEPTSAT